MPGGAVELRLSVGDGAGPVPENVLQLVELLAGLGSDALDLGEQGAVDRRLAAAEGSVAVPSRGSYAQPPGHGLIVPAFATRQETRF